MKRAHGCALDPSDAHPVVRLISTQRRRSWKEQDETRRAPRGSAYANSSVENDMSGGQITGASSRAASACADQFVLRHPGAGPGGAPHRVRQRLQHGLFVRVALYPILPTILSELANLSLGGRT